MIVSFDYFYDSVVLNNPDVIGNCKIADFSTLSKHEMVGFSDFPVTFPSLPEPYVTTQQYLDCGQLPAGGVAIDLGGYAGISAVAFSKAVGPSGRVIVLEPDPVSHQTAERNIARHAEVNGLNNVTLVKAAASDKCGEIQLSAEGTLGSAITSVIGARRGKVITVPAYTLDDIAELHQLTRCDFVKIDIEGSELPVVRSGEAFFRRFRPRVLAEAHKVNGTSCAPALVGLLESYGYTCKVVAQDGFDALPLILAVPTN